MTGSTIQKIVEVPNKNDMEVGKIRMTCADSDLKVPEPLQDGCFFYCFVGMPGSGKSNLVYSLICKKGFAYNKKFEFVAIFSASLKTLDKKLKLPDEQLFNGLDMHKLHEVMNRIEKSDLRALLIFDDVVASITRGMPDFRRLIWNRRHLGKGTSIMLVSQRLTAIPLELRSTATGMFFFNSQNQLELEMLRREFSGLRDEEFRKVLRAVFQRPYDFMYINLAQGRAQIYRNFNLLDITTDEDSGFRQPGQISMQ